MDFLGIGTLEFLVILLVAFIVLGPTRMMELAKGLGKMVREFRRSMSDITDALEEEDRKVRSFQQEPTRRQTPPDSDGPGISQH